MAFSIGDILGGGLGKLVKDVVGTFKLDPGVKAQIDAEVARNNHELAIKELEIQARIEEAHTKEIEAASGNIRAEAQSGDRYTSRARPSFIYVMLLILVCNYILFPFIHRTPIDYPEALFWLFGSAILGYTGARSWEKVGLPKAK